MAMPPPKRYAILGSIGLALFILLVVIISRPPPPPPVDENRVTADKKMQDARNAVRDARYEEAVQLIDEAEKLAPGIDKTKLGIQAREQLLILKSIAEARGLLEKQQFVDARKLLEKIPRNVNGKVDEARSQLDKDITAGEQAYKLAKLDEFLAAGELASAKQVLTELPFEQQAEPAARIAEFERQLEEQAAADQQAARQGAAAVAALKKQRAAEEMLNAFAVVERKFAGGEWDRAASECARVIQDNEGKSEIIARARSLQQLIPAFGKAYDEGMKKFRAGQIVLSARPLGLALQSYSQMGLRSNPYQTELADTLGQAGIAAGKEALLREDLLAAAAAFRSAARLDPADAKARQGLDDVANKAEDLYQQAYMIRGTDQRDALRKFKVVVEVTPAGSSLHEKAKNQVAAMSP